MRSDQVAIVGMAGRFPGAGDVDELWRNLCAGRGSIRALSGEELARAGVSAELARDEAYVRRSADLEGWDLFDAGFFGFTPREACVADPQQRLLLELAWEAFEDAGHVPENMKGAAGVFVGASRSDYAERVLADPTHLASLGAFAIEIATSRDFLATRLAYVLGLRGPALTVQTACSTSLVAVHLACQSLLAGECDFALAGGASVRLPQGTGYAWVEGGVASPDGHCRAFDARAAGTVAGSGGALVLLRPLEDALADGDFVHAVILGTAINNDGRAKVGFTAPSVEGQAAVIEEALAIAGLRANEIGYVEAHGTGTPLGDPIEVAALAEAFRRRGGAPPGSCAIGSVKASLGHLDAAAGIAGLVKAALAVRHGFVPPSLDFEHANPALGLERTPLSVAAELAPWRAGDRARRAGVSSFGIGGTNAHVVLEEPPAREPLARAAAAPQLAVVSARSASALERSIARLAERLDDSPELDAADVAWTLQTGRAVFPHRAFALGRSARELAEALRSGDGHRGEAKDAPPVAFLFPGQGNQRAGMALGAWRSEPLLRRELDRVARVLESEHAIDLSAILADERALAETRFAQPALFAVEYALARFLGSLGVEPAAMLGHSIGEYVAACLAEVLTLEDALRLVVERGRLMQAMPPGSMLAVGLDEPALAERVPDDVSIASVNARELCVASGPSSAIAELEARLAAEDVACRRLSTSHAFHSPMMDGALEPFREAVSAVELRSPKRAFLSNVTGTWITPEQATDPEYWTSHLRRTVRLAEGLGELARRERLLALEVGPGQSFASPARSAGLERVAFLARPGKGTDEAASLRAGLGRLWVSGAAIDWRALAGDEPRRRVRLPTYPFERQRHVAEERAAPRPAPPAEAPPEPVSAVHAVHEDAAGERSVQESVARVWRECLGISEVRPGDDFLELGGSSLLAISVRSRLAELLSVELPIADVLEATRLEELALRVERALAGSRPKRSPLVQLGQGRTRLYCVHGIDGDVLAFTHLARSLEPDCALVALRAPGLEREETPPEDVESLARAYVDAVRAADRGPYHLAGHSFGGLVALEMARLLGAAGERVASLAILDTRLGEPAPEGEHRDTRDTLALRERARAHLRRIGLVEDAPDAERRLEVATAHARAALAYRPRAFEGDALLVLARDESAPPADTVERAWRALVNGDLSVETTPGEHLSMLTGPRAEATARVLARWVAVARTTALEGQRP